MNLLNFLGVGLAPICIVQLVASTEGLSNLFWTLATVLVMILVSAKGKDTGA